MPRAVRFERYGGSEVLHLVDVVQPHPGPREVVVRLVAAATNPGEIMIREGALAEMWPATFPEGQGNDFSARVVEVDAGAAGVSVGDEVIGFAPRAAQADYIRTTPDRLARKPTGVPWEVAAAVAGAGSTAHAAVRVVRLHAGETVVVSPAAGGVGVIAAQLELGVAPDRINTTIDLAAAARYSVHADAQAEADSPSVWKELAELVEAGRLTIPIQSVYPLERVRDAYDQLAERHTQGKIVLRVSPEQPNGA